MNRIHRFIAEYQSRPKVQRRTLIGRHWVYFLIGFIFLQSGIEAWADPNGIPPRFEDSILYPAAYWRIMFPLSAVLSFMQLGVRRPPRLIEGAWLFFGTLTAFSRALQLCALSWDAQIWDWALGAPFWFLVGSNIVVALDHRIAYRDRALGSDGR